MTKAEELAASKAFIDDFHNVGPKAMRAEWEELYSHGTFVRACAILKGEKQEEAEDDEENLSDLSHVPEPSRTLMQEVLAVMPAEILPAVAPEKPLLPRSVAQNRVEDFNTDARRLRQKLFDLFQDGVHLSLGYSTWEEFAEAELKLTRTQSVYSQMRIHARMERLLGAEIPYHAAMLLNQVPVPQVTTAYRNWTDINGKIGDLKHIVNRLKPAPVVESPTGRDTAELAQALANVQPGQFIPLPASAAQTQVTELCAALPEIQQELAEEVSLAQLRRTYAPYKDGTACVSNLSSHMFSVEGTLPDGSTVIITNIPYGILDPEEK